MLLHRYGNIDYILNAPFATGFSFVGKARDMEEENIVWQLWISIFPHMSEDNYISFNDYKKRVLGGESKQEQKHQQTDEDMLNMCKMLNAMYGGEVVEV